jgi:rhomboid family GlyGly-CTERM serine protease
MTTTTVTLKRQKVSHRLTIIKNTLFPQGIPLDVIGFIVLLIFTNLHLLSGTFSPSLIFIPSAFAAGEWWRLVTHPFVHFSWYHLLLDAGAFFLLYKDLGQTRVSDRIYYVILCGTFGLIVPMLVAPLINTQGLCGLSGIAHGLMAVTALEMIERKNYVRTGLVLFSLVVAKSIYEAVHGDVILAFMHMGLCGSPLAVCHAGGVLGGMLAFCIFRWAKTDC